MIGQSSTKEKIQSLVSNGDYPRFTILVGETGSGKKLLCKYIANMLNAVEYISETSVEAIRNMITESYKVAMPIVYVIPDADRMSLAAKNALLKVTEEPPQNAYFIMTLSDSTNTLATLRSRAYELKMSPYTSSELIEYLHTKVFDSSKDWIIDICENPGEIDILLGYDADAFISYVNLTVDNIAKVSGSNAFKISDKIALKETDKDKYNLKMFWKAFMSVCSKRMTEDCMFATGVIITNLYLQDLRIVGINKMMLFDMWILRIRKEWMYG